MVITDYKHKEIRFTDHIMDKMLMFGLEKPLILEIVKTGYIIKHESANDKLVLKRYYGKCNTSYYLVIMVKPDFLEAITLWQKKGR